MAKMVEAKNGKWMLSSDYDELKAENERLRADIFKMNDACVKKTRKLQQKAEEEYNRGVKDGLGRAAEIVENM